MAHLETESVVAAVGQKQALGHLKHRMRFLQFLPFVVKPGLTCFVGAVVILKLTRCILAAARCPVQGAPLQGKTLL